MKITVGLLFVLTFMFMSFSYACSGPFSIYDKCPSSEQWPTVHDSSAVSARTPEALGALFGVIKMYVWREDDYIWVEVIPISGEVFICATSSFSIKQGNNLHIAEILKSPEIVQCGYVVERDIYLFSPIQATNFEEMHPGEDFILSFPSGFLPNVYVPVSATADGIPVGVPVVHLESPVHGSFESGIGLIRGWACNATGITVMIDADPAIETAYGAERLDSIGVCGDANNGFGFVVNWNRYPSGVHRLRAFADGAATPFADVTFNVFNIGVEYLSGVGSPGRSLSDFPAAASGTAVTWSEPHQGVVITGYTP